MMLGPRQLAEPARLPPRRDQRRARRRRIVREAAALWSRDLVSTANGCLPVPEEEVRADPVDRPITPEKVRDIASDGYPLWESLPVMQLRNRRITVAYSDLSERLARLIAGDDGRWDANWCTFATWSSKTIGTWIEHDAIPYPVKSLKRVPFFVKHGLVRASQAAWRRDDGATYRSLAAGNRFVFLEIGLSVASFIESFERLRRIPGGTPDEAAWDAYWERLHRTLFDLTQLDPSWLLTESPEPDDLRLGLRKYFDALYAADGKKRAELVLAGNLLIGAYEQRRVDGYLAASLALFTKRAMRALVHHRTVSVGTGRVRRRLTGLYGRLSTCGLVLKTHDEKLRIGKALKPPPGGGKDLYPPDLARITLPLLQALLTRYDVSNGRARGRRGRNWPCFDDRMNYITCLFRSRQQHWPLFVRPFEVDVEKSLLKGHLDPGPWVPLRDGDEEPSLVTFNTGLSYS